MSINSNTKAIIYLRGKPKFSLELSNRQANKLFDTMLQTYCHKYGSKNIKCEFNQKGNV